MIYIDPPYNTRHDFIYKDDYADNINNYKIITGQLNDVGHKNSTNSDTSGRYHSSSNVKLYAKLPGWFKIETPLGTYNPDWAVLWENDGSQKLYFIVETKGALSWEMLRHAEKGKIECGKKHFQALDKNVTLEVVNDFNAFRDIAVR